MSGFRFVLIFISLATAGLCFAESRQGTGQLLTYTPATSIQDIEFASIPKNRPEASEDPSLDFVLSDEEATALSADEVNDENSNVDSYLVELAKPQEPLVTSFAVDLKKNLLSTDWISQVERDYQKRLREYEMNRGYYAMNRDKRGVRPYGMTIEQERQLSEELAGETRNYMLRVGLPNFLRTRQATKGFGENYNQAIRAAQKVSSLNVQTEQGWRFNSGFDPFKITLKKDHKIPLRVRFWLNATNTKWKVEFKGDMNNDSDGYLTVLGRQVNSRCTVEWIHHLQTQYNEVTMGYSF